MIEPLEAPSTKKGSGSNQPEGGWTNHAPAGGITINGKFFGGGKFIPNDDLESASPEEMELLKQKQELVRKYGAEKAKEMMKGEVSTQDPSSSTATQQKNISAAKENLYLIDDGTILGGEFGEYIIKFKPDVNNIEIQMFNNLKTKRIDIVTKDKVYSLTADTWPLLKEGESLLDRVTKNESSIDDWPIFNNLTEDIRKLIKGEEKPVYRMSLLKPDTWEVEHNEENKIFRLCGCQEKMDSKLITQLYKNQGVPVANHVEMSDGLLYDSIKSVLEPIILDILFNLAPEYNANQQRTGLVQNIQNLPQEKVTHQILSPTQIDSAMEQVNYPMGKRSLVKTIILKRTGNDVIS